jgi:hypothetical protein
MISPLQNVSGVQPSPSLQLSIVLLLLLALASRPRWLVLSLLVCDEDKLRSHQLVIIVGLAHLPTLVFLMEGVQWTLRDWTKGLAVILRAQPQFCHTSPLAWLLVLLRTKHQYSMEKPQEKYSTP